MTTKVRYDIDLADYKSLARAIGEAYQMTFESEDERHKWIVYRSNLLFFDYLAEQNASI